MRAGRTAGRQRPFLRLSHSLFAGKPCCTVIASVWAGQRVGKAHLQTLIFVLLKTVFAEATLLFGRGMRAGIDRREQKKTAAEFEANMLRKSREAFGLATDTLQVGG